MKKTLSIILLGMLMASGAFAETAKYHGVFTLSNLNSGKQRGTADCIIIQNLSWEDYRIFTTCRFNGKLESSSFAGWPNGAGYDYELQMAFIKLGIDADKGFGKYLVDGMSMNDLSGASEMKVYFGATQPFTRDKTMFTGTNGDLFELDFAPGEYQ